MYLGFDSHYINCIIPTTNWRLVFTSCWAFRKRLVIIMSSTSGRNKNFLWYAIRMFNGNFILFLLYFWLCYLDQWEPQFCWRLFYLEIWIFLFPCPCNELMYIWTFTCFWISQRSSSIRTYIWKLMVHT